MRNLHSLFYLTIIALIGLISYGCISDDFTDSPNHTLQFSADTISFDTVFTEIGTPTARLIVYNRASKSVNIQSISFKKDNDEFKMNVDGVSGDSFRDVEIRGNDSIWIFIESYPQKAPSSSPYRLENQIVFVTNGVSQEVQVEAWGQNVTRLRNHRVAGQLSFTAEQPYVVFDSLVVEQGATLTLEPGTNLLFHDKGSLIVHGTLLCLGTMEQPVNLRSDRLDNVLPDTPYDLLAGQWDGVVITAESFGNRMEHVNMRSTVYGLFVDSCANLSQPKLTLRNSWLHNSQGSVLTSAFAWVDAYGCVFSEAANAVVALIGGKHTFVQTTIANNYLFSAITEPLLSLYHALPGEDTPWSDLPLMSARFQNSIIYGLGQDLNIGDFADSDVYLENVLLKSEGEDEDDAHFIRCVWNADPLFYTVRDDYVFNYHVMPDSPAIGAGDAQFDIDADCTIDPDGVNRLLDGAPTLGAFQFVPPATDEEKQ